MNFLNSSGLKQHLIPLLFIFICWFLSLSPLIFGNLAISWDLLEYALPTISYLEDSIRSGIFPFWNPFTLAGEAMFSQPATFVYSPVHFFIASMASFFGTYYSLQLTMLLLVLVGGIGVYFLFQKLSLSSAVATLAGIVYCLTAFGPLLGQPPIVVSIAFFPWVLLACSRIIARAQRGDAGGLVAPTLLLSLMFMSGYFATTLYILIFALAYSLTLIYMHRESLTETDLKNILVAFLIVSFFGFLIASIYFVPAIFNRFYFYRDLAGDFVSPELRMRGLVLLPHQIVDVMRNERTLLATIFGIKHLAPGRALWVIGCGQFFAFLGFWSLGYFRKNILVRFFSVTFIVSILYVLGPGGLVFDFVYRFVPVLKNIRYPVFAFFILQFSLIYLAAYVLNGLLVTDSRDTPRLNLKYKPLIFGLLSLGFGCTAFYLNIEYLSLAIVTFFIGSIIWLRGRKKAYRPIIFWLVCFGVVLEAFYFVWASGIYSGSLQGIIAKSSTIPRTQLYKTRVRPSLYKKNIRDMEIAKSYNFLNKKWILSKTPINHGYSTSDSPLYWYLKSHSFLKFIFASPTKVIASSLPLREEFSSDVEYLEALAKIIPDTIAEGVFLSSITDAPLTYDKRFSVCEFSQVQVTPNEFSASTNSQGQCLVFLTNKFFPGWTLTVDGRPTEILKVNGLFMGALVSKGQHLLKFQFSPPSFWIGLILSICGLLGLFLLVGWRKHLSKALQADTQNV